MNRKILFFGFGSIAAFVLWTLFIKFIDVKAIGPNGSNIGFATLNGFFHDFTGVNMDLYVLTDWLGFIPIFVMFGFAVFGFIQLLKRKNLFKVDFDILLLGGFYIILAFVFLFFEVLVINYRPVLIDGILEASYPSSTTLLVTCIMPTSAIQFKRRIKNVRLKKTFLWLISIFTVFMVTARLISGVHWLTDIIGGLLLSIGLVLIYYSIINLKR